jgi:hypothetical protein
MGRACSTNGEKRNTCTCRILVGKPEGKNHWEDQDVGGWIIWMIIWMIGWHGMDWIDLAQNSDKLRK